jgi:hypothetical protein
MPRYTQLYRALCDGKIPPCARLFDKEMAEMTGKVSMGRFVMVVLLGLLIVYPVGAEIPAGSSGTTAIHPLADELNQKFIQEIVDPDNGTVMSGTISLAPVAMRQTRLTLNKYKGYGLGGRLTSVTGKQLPFRRLARISIYKEGMLWKTIRACGMGFYRFRHWPLSKGTYEARFAGQDNLLPSVSRQIIVG